MVEGYKHTEVGLIPNDWEVKQLISLSDFSSGTTPRRDSYERYYQNGIIPWVKTLDLNNGEIKITEEKVTHLALREVSSLKIFPKDTVLIAMYGGFNQIGRTGILKIEAATNQALTAIKAYKELNPEFLINYLNFKINYWKDVASSSRKDPNITSKDVKLFPIALPPTKAEQTAIATALNDADALIQKLEHLIAKKRNIKTGAMQELLKPKEGWEEKTLHELADNKKELFDDGDWIEAEHITDNGIRIIQTGNIGVGCYVEKENKKYIFEDSFYKLKCKQLIEGDLLICRLAEPAGRACVLPNIGESRIVTSVDVTIFRPRSEVANRVFLANLFSTSDWFSKVIERVGGTTHKRISRSSLGKISISIPKIAVQTNIAKILSDMDNEIQELEKQLEKYKMMKQGMMQSLLTGKIRLV